MSAKLWQRLRGVLSVRHLPKVHDDGWPGADDPNAPLFMQFRWSGFSPAGAMERSAWFWRQVRRNGTAIGWQRGFDIVRILAPVVLWIGIIGVGLYYLLTWP